MGGRDKLTEPVAGRPILALLAGRACAAGAEVLVTLPPAGAEARRAALVGLEVTLRTVPDAAEGMAASLRAGATAAATGGHEGLMVLPADMPEIETADIRGMLAAFAACPAPRPILRACAADGRPGHPVILPARLFAELAAVQGDSGGRAVLRAHAAEIRDHPLPGLRAVIDLDTPEDWAAWRAAR